MTHHPLLNHSIDIPKLKAQLTTDDKILREELEYRLQSLLLKP